MAIREIVLYPDEPLTKPAVPVEKIGRDFEHLVSDMLDTMHTFDGVGLAGPQVGVSKRVLVLQEPNGPELCLINPEIIDAEGEEEGEEGCLSLPRVYGNVPRATRIHVNAEDIHGKRLDFEARDLLARIIQHELDHLNGMLFPDRLDIVSREAVIREWSELRRTLAQPGHKG